MGAVMSLCDGLASGYGAVVGAICLVLLTLLLALIALGFGPLRPWLTPALARWAPAVPSRSWDAGLLGAWRLYRQLGAGG